jgi:hypothetical protein
MSETSHPIPPATKRLGFAAVALCGLCCALPLGTVLFGAGAIAVLGRWLEWGAIAALIGAGLAYVLYRVRKHRAAPACDIDCATGRS